MFMPKKMTVELENGCIVEFDFNNTDSTIVSTSVPLTQDEKCKLLLKVGVFIGGGTRALTGLDKLVEA